MNMGVQATDGRRLDGSTRRQGRLATLAFAMMIFAAVRPGLATPIFVPYGQALSIDTATGDTYAVQGGSLDLKQNGHVLSLSLSIDDRAKVTISGGRVDAGVDVGAGRLDVAGGTIRGYQAVPGGYGGNALTITSIAGASVHVTGGTFIGGDSIGDAPGSAIANYGTTMDGKMYLSTLNIDGGTFVGGKAAHSDGYSLIAGGNTTITGGDFQSSILIPSYGGTTTFLGSDLAYNDSTHILSGILRNGDPIHVLIDPMGDVKIDGSGSEIRFWSVSAYPIGNPTSPGTTTPAVPEPTTITIFILMSAGGLARGRRLARGCS